ncbi:hypothetical protein, partial [Frankia sp. CiP1_Cm_nod1]|uniref:hypothetical protein n=1 Tax=Frankia sp. CiP1_Cm_nod1 TaxID=2897160 RepID=UPI002024A815
RGGVGAAGNAAANSAATGSVATGGAATTDSVAAGSIRMPAHLAMLPPDPTPRARRPWDSRPA